MTTDNDERLRTIRESSRRLAAYLPLTLARRILDDGLPVPGQPHSLMAATLFSDISGFTAMSEELASDGPRGAEELNRVLLTTFTAMIDVIHDLGGAVSHFYGDAMSVYFPDDDGRAAQRALACAQSMQQLMLVSFDRVVTNRPPGKNPFFQLTSKVGVGYGLCHELVVGDAATCLEFVLAGAAVEEAAAAERAAQSGEVLASRAVLAQAGLPETAAFRVLDGPLPVPAARPLLDWLAYNEAALARLASATIPFIPPALYERSMASLDNLAEHRPVTSLFVQFTLASEADQTAIETAVMGEQLQQYYEWARRVVARFGSQNARVNRVLTGDKGNQLHIMFGAPVAPDAPEQAIRCALALQREQPDFIAAQSIGLAAGKVFAGPVGSSSRREYTVVGDVVNLSARLSQACEAGDVLTDAVTAERARDLIEFDVLPPVYLKGRQAAVTPYRPSGEWAVATQVQAYFGVRQKPLVGRDQELDLLLGGLDVALRGVGGVAALSGSTGVGKTRLLAAGVEHWLQRGGVGLVGLCYQHTVDTPYGPWRHIWRDFFNLHALPDPEAQAAAVIRRTLALVPDSAGDVGLWVELLGLPIPAAENLLELTAEARQARFFTLVRRCLQAAAAVQPLLIILEDVHWADQSSLALIDELSSHLESCAIFIALTFRPMIGLALDVLDRPQCLPIAVPELSPDKARQLLQALLGVVELPAAVEQHLGLRDREGRDSPVNPLFLEEALNVMMGAGVLEVNGRLRVNEALLAQMQVPDNIHGLLLARLDRLPAASRDLLQVASVIGRQFALEPLQQLTPTVSRQIITELLSQLSAEEMTRLVTTDPEWIYLFQHAMTHEVAYESLPYARRQKLHAAIADWLVAQYGDNLKPLYPVLAYHYSRSGIHEEGMRFALAAADNARDIFANKEAVELYRLAEGHLKTLGEEVHWQTAADLYLSRGQVLIVLGDIAGALADAERALALALAHSAPTPAAKAYNLIAEALYRQARYDDVQTLTGKVMDELAPSISLEEVARAYMWHGLAASSKLDYDVALRNLQEAEKICLRIQDNARLARVLEAIGLTYLWQRKLEPALEAMQRSVQLSRAFSTPVNIGVALNNIAFVQYNLGQVQEALQTFNEAVAIGRETSRNLLVLALGNRAAAFSYLGRFSEALVDFEEALGLFDGIDYQGLIVETYLLWGYDYSSVLNDWADARYRFEKAQALIETRPESYPEERARLLIGLGQVELRQGAVVEAASLIDTAAALIEEKELNWWKPAVYYFRGLTCLALRDEASAQTYLRKGLEAVDLGGCPDYLPLLLLELAQLATGEQRLSNFEACAEAAQRRARYLDGINCLRSAGDALLRCEEKSRQRRGIHYLRQAEALELREPALEQSAMTQLPGK